MSLQQLRSKSGKFYTPQELSSILSGIVTLDCQNPQSGMEELSTGIRFCLWFGFTAAQRAPQDEKERWVYRQDIRAGEKHYYLQLSPHEYDSARHEGFGIRDSSR